MNISDLDERELKSIRDKFNNNPNIECINIPYYPKIQARDINSEEAAEELANHAAYLWGNPIPFPNNKYWKQGQIKYFTVTRWEV